jgi:hypothetical protein
MKKFHAELPIDYVFNACNLGNKKEVVSTISVSGRISGKIKEIIDVRFYMSKSANGASPVHCSVWVCSAERSCSGYGVASGYGYHKQSAALEAAFKSAGITFWDKKTTVKSKKQIHFGGTGDGPANEACESVARALGGRGKLLTIARG